MPHIYSQLIKADLENLASAPSPTSRGRVYFDTTLNIARMYNGTSWIGLSASAAPASIDWWNDFPNSPELISENNLKVFKFQQGVTTQQLYGLIKVPQGYGAGTQVKMFLGMYSPGTTGTALLTTNTYLIRKDTDAISSTANSQAGGNSALTNSVANQYRQVTVNLTDASGLINSVSVNPGDLLVVVLTRGSDSDSNELRFLPAMTEVKFV